MSARIQPTIRQAVYFSGFNEFSSERKIRASSMGHVVLQRIGARCPKHFLAGACPQKNKTPILPKAFSSPLQAV
jgi:hypothetical protein